MLAEWTVAVLHIRELILVLDEESAAVLTHRDGNVRYHVLEVSLLHLWAEMRHVLNEDFLEAHTSHDLFVDNDWTIVIRILLVVHPLKDCLSEQIILQAFILVVCESHGLLIVGSCGPLSITSV